MSDEVYLREGATLHGGAYRIERVLGQGGFGITYLAVHTLLKRKVAIKEFFPKTFCDRDADTSQVHTASKANAVTVEKLRSKFIKEAEHIAKMDSPYIVRITDVFADNNTAYYVMDYIEGSSLADMVKGEGPLPLERAIGYVTKVGEALTYIHSQRINHLDVKPANIMVRKKDDAPILVDFGLSKQYDSEGNQTSTTPVGISHGYAPIEQYRDGGVKEFSPQTDLYSLAATLYYLLSGKVPPQAGALIEDDLTFPASIPAALQPVIRKAMDSARKKRHENIPAFLHDLHSASSTPVEEKESEDTVIQLDTKSSATDSEAKSVASNPSGQLVTEERSEPTDSSPKPKSKRTWLILAAIAVVAGFVWVYMINDSSDLTPEEMAEKGVAAYYAKNYVEALDWFQKAAPKGNARAQAGLGAMYFYGYEVTQSMAKAVEWLSKAAEQGHSGAQNDLGYMYENGLGIKQSYPDARKWYLKAAEQGDTAAQNSVGSLYEKGLGGDLDYKEAVRWYLAAANQGHIEAQNNVARIYHYDYVGFKNDTESFKWYLESAKQGNATGMYKVAEYYEAGIGTTKDLSKAREWYGKAAEVGHTDAAAKLKELK